MNTMLDLKLTKNLSAKPTLLEESDEGHFVSKDGFPFNAFDDRWMLKAGRKKGMVVYLDWLSKSQFTEDAKMDIRMSLGAMAEKLSFCTVNSVNYMLKSLNIPSFDVPTIQSYWVTYSNNIQRRLKSFSRYLYKYSPKHYLGLYSWLKDMPYEQRQSVVYDPLKGALSDVESRSFDFAMNQKMQDFINNSSVVTPASLTVFSIHIMARLLQVVVRRPINLMQLKWNDILPVGVSFNDQSLVYQCSFSDAKELHIRLWRAKQGNAFRAAVEEHPFLVSQSISKEILLYRQAYSYCLKERFRVLGINLNETEFNELLLCCPLAFAGTLFSTEFISKKEILTALGTDSDAFHKDSAILNSTIYDFLSHLNLKSDRIPVKDLIIGNNRIRHTVGTNAARSGKNIYQIAKLLGNTLRAAQVYIDLSNEQRANIDDRFIANDFLVNAFSVDIETVKDEASLVSDESGNESGQCKSTHRCAQCTETNRPICCYGCDNFKALLTGDHRSVLKKAKQCYNYRIQHEPQPVFLERLGVQIRYIQATIEVCDKMLQKELSHDA